MKAFFEHILWTIYVSPLWCIWVAMAMLIVVWGVCGAVFSEKFPKQWRYLNIFCCVVSVSTIIYTTLLNRSRGEHIVQLIPLHFFIEAKEHIEILRSMLMNAFLFVPFGLSLPFVISKPTTKAIKITLISALIFSVGIEAIQFFFGFGRAETDDVLCNVFGTLIGCLAFIFSVQRKKLEKE